MERKARKPPPPGDEKGLCGEKPVWEQGRVWTNLYGNKLKAAFDGVVDKDGNLKIYKKLWGVVR